MLRLFVMLGVNFTMATLTLSAAASGDSPPDTANERPQVEIKRILESGGTDKAILARLARFVRVGDTEKELRRRIGEPQYEQWLEISETAFYYQSRLLIILKKGQVTFIGCFGKGLRFLKQD
jgi:hypothetical protein